MGQYASAIGQFAVNSGVVSWQGAGIATAAGGGLWLSTHDWSAPEKNVQNAIDEARSLEYVQNRSVNNWVLGQSFDATLASPGGGYNVEGGWFLGNNGKQGSDFVSHGIAYGVEASLGWNLLLINPKNNFKFRDLEGMGASWTLNYGLLSISAFGNSSPGYPENSVFDSYKGYKIGIGVGFGGSIAPNSNTVFQKWLPSRFKKINWLDLHWH